MRTLTAEVSGVVGLPIAQVFDVFAPIDLTRIMPGFGPMPAVAGVEHQTGAWWFEGVGPERTLARWRYEFEPRSALTRPLAALIVRGLWQPYMARGLRLATELAERAGAGSPATSPNE